MEKILLVEDNEHILNINTSYLKSRGYGVFCAESVKAANALLSEHAFDLVVLDIILPDGSGIDLCKSIRRTSGCPVLFLTARVTDEDVINGLETGADDYLTKPYDLAVFGSRVKALLRRSMGVLPVENRFSVGSLCFDIVKAQAYIDETEINLSSKEFGILLYLAQHRGKKTSKEELFGAVWGADNSSDYTIVWTTVSRLKKKIAGYEAQFYLDSSHDGYELVIIQGGVR